MCGSILVCKSPHLFAAYHVLRRLQEPRHPPYALIYFLTYSAPRAFCTLRSTAFISSSIMSMYLELTLVVQQFDFTLLATFSLSSTPSPTFVSPLSPLPSLSSSLSPRAIELAHVRSLIRVRSRGVLTTSATKQSLFERPAPFVPISLRKRAFFSKFIQNPPPPSAVVLSLRLWRISDSNR